MDNRIGHISSDGVNWPAVDATGAAYDRPVSTMALGGGAFVCIPVGFDQWELIDEIKAGMRTPAPARKSKMLPSNDEAGDND